jgi:hypothetical protein
MVKRTFPVNEIEQLCLFTGQFEIFHCNDPEAAFLDFCKDVPGISVPYGFGLDHGKGNIFVHLFRFRINGCKIKILLSHEITYFLIPWKIAYFAVLQIVKAIEKF